MRQVAFHCQTDIGCWLHRRQIWPTLGPRQLNVGYWLHCQQILPPFCQHWPNSPTSTTTQAVYLYIMPMLGQRWIFIQDGGEQ